jgi:transcriptional regulator with XRE-family HTH domain
MPRRAVPDPQCQKLGARVRELRQEQGLSIGALAEAGELSKGHLSNIERGHVNVTVGTVVHIAKTLEVVPLHVMCFGDSPLEKVIDELRAMPEKEQRKLLEELSRTLFGGVKRMGARGA